jgi:DNA-binding MarR family transcriptional regulator
VSRRKTALPEPIGTEVATTGELLQGETLSRHVESTGYLVREAHRAFSRTLAERLTPHGISPAQWSALRALWREDGYSQVELAQRMQVEKASLTSVLDALERRGLVTRVRNSEDRRKSHVYLTPAGRQLEKALLPYAGDVNGLATGGIDPIDLEMFQRILRQIIKNLR